MSVEFPLQVTNQGVSVTIGKVEKGGRWFYRVLYREQGKRKQAWRADFKDAKRFADDAIDAILTGDASALKLNFKDRHTYLRAVEILRPIGVELDVAARECADLRAVLGGKTTPIEACRDWATRNAVELPKITISAAAEEFKKQCIADGKGKLRLKEITLFLNRFTNSFNQEVHTITPKLIADHLSALVLAERTRRNHRNGIGFFNRWLVMRGYLARGTDWLDGVQNYSLRQHGEITTYTTTEMRRMIAAADKRILPLIVIGGFAGLRHAEIARLEWEDIDLQEGFIEVKADKSKTKTRRIVPIKDNLKKFLEPLAKANGKVVTIKNTSKELGITAGKTVDEKNGIEALEWKHNALRHTYISARVAECADVSRVADEAGNSPQVIRTNYLKRMRPAMAAEWFAIEPPQ